MIISNDKINKMKKVEGRIKKMALVLLLFFLVACIAAAGFAHKDTEKSCFYATIGAAASAAAVIIVACVIEPRWLLGVVGIKRNQKLYAISYWDLSIIEVRATGVNLYNTDRIIWVDGLLSSPLHRDIYLTKQEAEGALSWFLEGLYSDVKNYVGYKGPLSEEAKKS